MKVTDQDYSIDKIKLEKLNLICKRVSGGKKLQNVMGCDGQEGFGKSTITAGDAYYISYKLKRPLLLFFDIEKLIDHAINNKDCIYIWDDAAFAALSMEAYNKVIIKFIKTVLLARKNRHTYFINIQEIFRLKEPLVSRMLGLTHVYSPDEINLGTYAYYKKDALQRLYDDWQRKKKKNYKEHYTFRSRFPNILYKIFNEEEYENLKDQAILSISEEKEDKKTEKLNEIKYNVANLILNQSIDIKEAAEQLGINERTIYKWKNIMLEGDGSDMSTASRPNTISSACIEPNTMYYNQVIKNKGEKTK